MPLLRRQQWLDHADGCSSSRKRWGCNSTPPSPSPLPPQHLLRRTRHLLQPRPAFPHPQSLQARSISRGPEHRQCRRIRIKIYRGGTQIATTASTNYADSGLSVSTNYSYTVAAYDAAGNNSPINKCQCDDAGCGDVTTSAKRKSISQLYSGWHKIRQPLCAESGERDLSVRIIFLPM